MIRMPITGPAAMTGTPKLGTVIALDIATTTGWALHNQTMQRPFFGALRVPGGKDNIGAALSAMLTFLQDIHDKMTAQGQPITHIFYEKPFIPGQVNSDTSERLMGLCAVTQLFAYRIGTTSCYSIDISEWRKHFIGRGAGFKRTPDKKQYLPGHDPKELAMQQCARFGWHTDIADAAEACGVLDYAISMMDRSFVNAGLPGYPRPWRDRTLLGGAA